MTIMKTLYNHKAYLSSAEQWEECKDDVKAYEPLADKPHKVPTSKDDCEE